MKQPVQVLVYPVKKSGKHSKYLLLKRVESRGGFWQGVTGGLEEGETPLEAARRELFEETGFNSVVLYDTRIKYKLHVKDIKNQDGIPPGTVYLPEHLFYAVIGSLDIPSIDLKEHDEWNWCTFEEAIEMLSWENNKKALSKIQKLLEKV